MQNDIIENQDFYVILIIIIIILQLFLLTLS